jgi:NADH-quinone oxidoreductase subunit A
MSPSRHFFTQRLSRGIHLAHITQKIRKGSRRMTSAGSLFFYAFLVVGFAVGILLVSHYVGRRCITSEKTFPYECGMSPFDRPSTLFSIKFYIIALIFVIFDVETVFIYLWAVVVKKLGFFGLVEMGVFIGILLVAFFYVWKKGGLSWES